MTTNTDKLAAQICRDVAELPDRNSPEDWPEAMLVTHDELQAIVTEALEAAGRVQQAGPFGYMNPGHVHELQQKRMPYGYVYPNEAVGADIPVYLAAPAERAPAPTVAEPMRTHVEEFATKSGWNRSDGEGAFEFIQRKCYHQGWQDGRREALGDVHRDTPEVAAPTAQEASKAVPRAGKFHSCELPGCVVCQNPDDSDPWLSGDDMMGASS